MSNTLMILLLSGLLLGLLVMGAAAVLLAYENARKAKADDQTENAEDAPWEAQPMTENDASGEIAGGELDPVMDEPAARMAVEPAAPMAVEAEIAPAAPIGLAPARPTPEPSPENTPITLSTAAAPDKPAAPVAAPPMAVAPAPPPVAPPPAAAVPTSGAMAEVLRVFQGGSGQVMLQMGNAIYLDPSAVTDPATRAQLDALVVQLQQWLAQSPTAMPPPPATAASHAAEPVETGVTTPPTADTPIVLSTSASDAPASPAPTVKPDPSADVIRLSAREAVQRPLMKPSWNISEQLRQLRQYNAQPKVEIKSMLEEMDEILQARIGGSPLAKRGLKIAEGPDGALQIQLDGQTYAGVDELNDPDARAYIQAAIAAWEDAAG